MRSRAVSLPALCSRSRRSGPPPASASAEIRWSSSMRSRCLASGDKPRFVSDNGASRGRRFLGSEDAHSEMRSEPDGAEQEDYAKEQLCTHGEGAAQGRFERSHVFSRLHQNEHCAESQGHDENGCQEGSDDHFHASWLWPLQRGKEKDSAIGQKSERGRLAVAGNGISDREGFSASASKLSASQTSHRRR